LNVIERRKLQMVRRLVNLSDFSDFEKTFEEVGDDFKQLADDFQSMMDNAEEDLNTYSFDELKEAIKKHRRKMGFGTEEDEYKDHEDYKYMGESAAKDFLASLENRRSRIKSLVNTAIIIAGVGIGVMLILVGITAFTQSLKDNSTTIKTPTTIEQTVDKKGPVKF